MSAQISHKYRCIFVHVPKAGGTSIEETSLFEDQKKATGERVGGHRTALEFRDEFPEEFKTYFKFAIVRNPFDRLVSSFFYLSGKGCNNAGDRRAYEQYIAKYQGNFEAFCLDFITDENIYKLTHLKPQAAFVCDTSGNQIVDFVGKLETIGTDFQFICETIGFAHLDLGHKRKSKHSYYTQYYTRKTRDIIEQVYRKDIELFGYQYEQPMMHRLRFLMSKLPIKLA